jgi:YD repeat-containing protein
MKSKIILLLIFLITIAFSGPAFSATYTYDNANRLLSIDHGNGTVINYTYDANGNMVSMSVNDAFPPTGAIAINSGAATTTLNSVTLSVSATDSNGTITEMRFSNDNSIWSAWEPYATTKAWTLSAGLGIKTVYAQFKDSTNDISLPTSDSIELLPHGADLTVASFSAPVTASLGTNISINYQVQNIGTIPSTQSEVQFYLTTDPVNVSPSDILLNQSTINAIAEGANYSGIVSLLQSNITAGVYYIRAKADATGTNAELDETNNYRVSSAITLTEDVDLIVESLSLPVSAPNGSQITVNSTIRNQGSVNAVASSVAIYLTTDPVNSQPSDILLTQSSISAVQAGASTQVASTVVIPANAVAGTYYIRTVADSGGVLFEHEEDNNSRTSDSIQIIDSALKLFAQMDGNWLDSSGGGSNGTAVNGVTFSTTFKYGTHSGSFNGSNYVNFGNTSAFNITSAVTVEAWIKPNSTSGTQFVAGRPYSTSTSWSSPWVGWHIGVRNGKMATWLNVNGTDREYDSGTITAGVWHHIVMTFDGTWRKSYINGVNVYSSNAYTGTIEFSGNPSVVVGVRSATSSAEYFNGLIDNVRIYSRALTSEEVLQNYNNDNVPPSGSILINSGALRTNSESVTLTLSATDNSGTVSQMRFSNDNVTWSTWEAYGTTKAWALSASDGNKTVYVQFKDALANTSTYSNSITLDTTAPVVSASPVGGTFTSAQSVTLSTNEQATIYYTIDGSTPTIASPVYSSPISINASTTLKYIGVDPAENQSAVQTQSYIIDSAPPTGSISINAGAASTNSESVTLTLSATDDSGTVSQMRFSNDNATWSAWEPYGITKAWILSEGNGTKTVYAEFMDSANNVSIPYSDTITFSSPNDLYMVEATAPTTRTVGHTLSISYTIQNIGTSNSSSFAVQFYLSTDPVNPKPADVLLGQTSHTMNASETLETAYNTTVPVNTTPGTYYVRVIADTGNTNAETNENNNTAVSGAMSVLAQTIDIYAVEATAPVTRSAGQALSIYYTLQNIGTGPSSAFDVKFYLTTDPINPNPADVLLGQTSHTMNASETLETVYNTTLPANAVAGTYYVRVVADTGNTNAETNENNNTVVSGAMSVTSGIDLVVSALSPPANAQTGAYMAMSSTVSNNGAGTSAYSWLNFNLSDDTVIDSSDIILGSRLVGNVAGGGSSPGTTNLYIPLNTALGTYYIIGKADSEGENIETNETNNIGVSSGTTAVTYGVDLVVSALSMPPSAQTGATIAVSSTVLNNGTGASTNSWLKFYLSADTGIDSSDVILGSRLVANVAGGGSSSGTTNLYIPLNTALGNYYIIGKADTENENPESNETNNVGVSSEIISIIQ